MAVENNASAISINIVPSTQTVQNGDAVSADVVISGLTSANEIVSAYELNIGYDASILDATSVTFGSYLDDLSFPGFSGTSAQTGSIPTSCPALFFSFSRRYRFW